VVTFVVYLPSLDNGFLNWDDNAYVTENPLLAHPTLHDLLTIPIAGNYHPLTMVSLVVNYRLSGLDPASYHWLNLWIHLANTALVFLFVRKLSGGRFWTTIVTSAFFGIHPTHVESVAWVSERKDVLYTFFYLIALMVYLRYLDTRRALWLMLSSIPFVLSLAAKPAAVVLPLTLLAIDYFRRRPWSPSIVLEKIPFVALSIAAGLLTIRAQHLAGAIAAPELWSPFKKALFASYATVMYVLKLFIPVHLSAVYPYPRITVTKLGPQFYAAFSALAILLPTVLYLCRRVRVVLFGLAFFFINILLVLPLFTVGGSVMADRYTYLPYVGLFFALSWWLDAPGNQTTARSYLRPVLAGLLLLLFPFSLIQTWKRCDVWQDSETFWNDTIQKYPHQIVDAYNNRGNYYYRSARRVEEALADYDEALALNPLAARTWMNKAMVLADQNRNDSALVSFDHVLELRPNNTEALNNRGVIEYRTGDLAKALADFSRAIDLNPEYRDAYLNRALSYFDSGEYEKSIADRRRAIELQPGNPANFQESGSIADALQRLNRPREAIAEYGKAIQTAPPGTPLGGYYHSRSYAWWALRDRANALGDAQEAQRLGVRVDPAYIRRLGAAKGHP